MYFQYPRAKMQKLENLINNRTHKCQERERWIKEPLLLLLLSRLSCLTLWDPIDSSPPSSSIHGISQARVLQWDATAFSKRTPKPWQSDTAWAEVHLSGHLGGANWNTYLDHKGEALGLCWLPRSCQATEQLPSPHPDCGSKFTGDTLSFSVHKLSH